MNCENCNSSIKKGDKFCSKCGYLNHNYKENVIDKTIENSIKIVRTNKKLVTQEITDSNYVNKYWNLLNNISLNFSFYSGLVLFLFTLFFQTDFFRDAIRFSGYSDNNIYSDITFNDFFSLNYLSSNSFFNLFHAILAVLIYPILFIIIKYMNNKKLKNYSFFLTVLYLISVLIFLEIIDERCNNVI